MSAAATSTRIAGSQLPAAARMPRTLAPLGQGSHWPELCCEGVCGLLGAFTASASRLSVGGADTHPFRERTAPTDWLNTPEGASLLTRRRARQGRTAGATARSCGRAPEDLPRLEPGPPDPCSEVAGELPPSCVEGAAGLEAVDCVCVATLTGVVVFGSGSGGGAVEIGSGGVVVWGIGSGGVVGTGGSGAFGTGGSDGAGTDAVTEVSDSSAPQDCTGTAERTANANAAAPPTFARLSEAFPWLLKRMSIYL